MGSTIAVALSGGVDSLVAADLLRRKGYHLLGVHFLTGFENYASGGRGDDTVSNLAKARLAPISEQLQVPIKVVDLSSEFKKNVIDYFINTYLSGQTPNPCLVCNPSIKFELLARCAADMGAKALATGHYACRIKTDQNAWQLHKSVDPHKDQSYFLARLTQKQLAFARFPLGTMHKKETMAVAKKNGLKPIYRTESQDICFIKNGKYGDFLADQSEFKIGEGPIETLEGRVIGTHPGLHLFTIGQRRGINCPAAEPYYVVRIIPERNCLVVGFKQDLNCTACKVTGINWINATPMMPFKAGVKVRYRHHEVPATIIPEDDTSAMVRFDTPQKAVTPGQGAVFYNKNMVMGGGWIAQPLLENLPKVRNETKAYN